MPWIWRRWCLFDSKLVQTYFATITKQKSNEKEVLRINSFKKNNFSFTENDYGREFKLLMKWFIYLMDLSILCLIYEIMWPLRRIISFLMLYQVVIEILLCAKLITGLKWTPYYFFFVELVKFLALDEIAVWRPEWSNQVWKKLYFSNLISAKVWSTLTPCLKIAEKVSFNIASEASYVYILSGQKWSILARFWRLEACGQMVLPDRSILVGQKLVGKCQNSKIQMRHFK